MLNSVLVDIYFYFFLGKTINLKEKRNSYFCVKIHPPKTISYCLPHENIKKSCHKKVIVCFYNLREENF